MQKELIRLKGWKRLLVIVTSRSAGKDDSVPISPNARVVEPSHYLDDNNLILKLLRIRKNIFSDPRTNVGKKVTYAFDLYMKAGRVYRQLLKNNYDRLKTMLLQSDAVEWFFLSGGYGVIHALEKAQRYQATFNYNIARQKGIPYTAKLWDNVLTKIYDAIFSKFDAKMVYVFGSKDYTHFIKNTRYWKEGENTRIFESTGRSGPFWLSPILSELGNSIIENKVDAFNAKYQGKFIKQILRDKKHDK